MQGLVWTLKAVDCLYLIEIQFMVNDALIFCGNSGLVKAGSEALEPRSRWGSGCCESCLVKPSPAQAYQVHNTDSYFPVQMWRSSYGTIHVWRNFERISKENGLMEYLSWSSKFLAFSCYDISNVELSGMGTFLCDFISVYRFIFCLPNNLNIFVMNVGRKFDLEMWTWFVHYLRGQFVWACHQKNWKCVPLSGVLPNNFFFCITILNFNECSIPFDFAVLTQKVSGVWEVSWWQGADWVRAKGGNEIRQESTRHWWRFSWHQWWLMRMNALRQFGGQTPYFLRGCHYSAAFWNMSSISDFGKMIDIIIWGISLPGGM